MTAPSEVKGVLEDLLSTLGMSSVACLVRLNADWPGIVGPLLAGKTSPARLRNGVLTVIVRNHAWAQELQLGKTSLLSRINRTRGGETIQDIRFLVAPLPAGEPPLPRRDEESPAAPSFPEPEGISDVSDPEIRDILRSLSRKAASRKS